MLSITEEKKKTILILVTIAVLASVITIFQFAVCKKTAHFDELYSYGTSNSINYGYGIFNNREWKDPAHSLRLYLSVQKGEQFDYITVWKNQENDVHPPLYYALIHTACSMVAERFSLWIAMLINLIFLILTLPALYFLEKKLFYKEKTALLICLCFACSPLAINITMFLRMYTVLLCISTWCFFLHLEWLDHIENFRKLIIIYILIVFGFLTHYYFLVFLFFTALGTCMILIRRKKIKKMFEYCGLMGITGGICIATYPASLKHIFSGYRGEEAFSSVQTYDGYFQIVGLYIKQLSLEIYRNKWALLISVIFLSIIIALSHILKYNGKRVISPQYSKYVIFAAGISLGYFFIITKVSSMHLIRYLAAIYALIYALIFGILCSLCECICVKKIKKFLTILLFIFAIGISICIDWKKDYVPQSSKIAEKYGGYDCIYMAGDDDWHVEYEILNNYFQVINYRGLYVVNVPYDNSFIDERLLSEESIIVYIDNKDNVAEVQALLLDSLPQMKTFTYLFDASGTTVYLLET